MKAGQAKMYPPLLLEFRFLILGGCHVKPCKHEEQLNL